MDLKLIALDHVIQKKSLIVFIKHDLTHGQNELLEKSGINTINTRIQDQIVGFNTRQHKKVTRQGIKER